MFQVKKGLNMIQIQNYILEIFVEEVKNKNGEIILIFIKKERKFKR